MMRCDLFVIVLCAFLFCRGSCWAEDSPTPDQDGFVGVAGYWCNLSEARPLCLEIKQNGSNLRGSWASLPPPVCPRNPPDSLGGTLKGKVHGDLLSAVLKASRCKCKFAINARLLEPPELVGDYAVFGCRQGGQEGTFDLLPLFSPPEGSG